MKLKSNAKINLSLKIIGKENGYHLIDSIFVPINIYDDIEIIEHNCDVIEGMDISINDNIIYKAICLIRNEYNIKKHFKVVIDKIIPVQAGLGGGSSNAAMTLKILNKMLGLNLSNERLVELGLLLGSDVPFFIYNKPSNVYGRGEIIKPIDNFGRLYGVLVFDDMYFSTKNVYDTYDHLVDNKLIGDFGLNNDLEIAARKMQDGNKIELIENDLISNGAYTASLTGSGGSIFGLFRSEQEANDAEKKLKDKYKFVHSFVSIE